MTQPSKMTAFLELTLASVLWGFGFIGTVWALRFLSFPAVLFYRFSGAFLFGALVWLWVRPSLKDLLHDFKMSIGLGFWLAFTLILQTWGLETTSATKSAFITVLYVVIVPILAATLDRQKPNWLLWGCLVLALFGTGLIVDVNLGDLKQGDLLTIGNAFAAAIHIRRMSQLAPNSKNQFNFNLFQCFWTALFASPLLLLEFLSPDVFRGDWNLWALDQSAWIGILSLTFGSSLFAFFLQVRAQKHLSATLSALLFLMESPFSAFFAAWLLHESLSLMQIFGALCIFGACALASFFGSQHNEVPHEPF